MFKHSKSTLPGAAQALPDRPQALAVAERHYVLDAPLKPPFPGNARTAVFGMGCFWGAERLFWQLDGVLSTAVGYAGGLTANPTYRDVCSGGTGHTEVVQIAFDPARIGYADLLKVFWEAHDPTQGMRQGNDRGTQYRSAIYTLDADQAEQAEQARDDYQRALRQSGHGDITTEIAPLATFYYAEDDHQQYLAKNPNGYCGIGGTGVICPIGLATSE